MAGFPDKFPGADMSRFAGINGIRTPGRQIGFRSLPGGERVGFQQQPFRTLQPDRPIRPFPVLPSQAGTVNRPAESDRVVGSSSSQRLVPIGDSNPGQALLQMASGQHGQDEHRPQGGPAPADVAPTGDPAQGKLAEVVAPAPGARQSQVAQEGHNTAEETVDHDEEENTDSPKLVYPSITTSGTIQNLNEQLISGYASLIESGALAPGSPLPSTGQLHTHCGVSLNTARSAYAELQSMGLIEIRQGTGSIVRRQGGKINTNMDDPLGLETAETSAALGITRKTNKVTRIEMPTAQDMQLFGIESSDPVVSQDSSDYEGEKILSTTTIRTPMIRDGVTRIGENPLKPASPEQAVRVLRARMPTLDEMDTFELELGTPVMDLITFHLDPTGVEMVSTKIMPADRNTLTSGEVSETAESSPLAGTGIADLTEFVYSPDAERQPAMEKVLYPEVGSRGAVRQRLVTAYAKNIVNGTLPPGSPLPPTRLLMEKYGVARNTIIGAFSTLDRMGLIEMQQGRIMTVREKQEQMPTDIAHPSRREAPDIRHQEGNSFRIESVTEKDERIFGIDKDRYSMTSRMDQEYRGTTLVAMSTSYRPVVHERMRTSDVTYVPSNPDKNRSVITVRMPSQDELGKFHLSAGVPVIEIMTYYLGSGDNAELAVKTVLPADKNKIIK